MAKTTNLQGTSLPHFRIGISGPTVYFGTTAPGGGVPTPITDGLKNGDLFIRTDNPNQAMFQYDSVGTLWNVFAGGGGSGYFPGNVTVDGQLTVGDNLIELNALEGGSGISHPSGEGGIEVNRGVLSSVRWVFDETNDWWQPDSVAVGVNNVYVPENLKTGIDGITLQPGLTVTGGYPMIHFAGDEDTGISSPSSDYINFHTAGSARWQITNIGNFLPVSTPYDIGATTAKVGNIYGTRILLEDGTAGAPALGFNSETNTGMYFPGSNQIGFSTGGNDRLVIQANGALRVDAANYDALVTTDDILTNKKYVDDSVAAVGITYPLLAPAGTAVAPSYNFTASPSTGMYLSGSDLALSAGGAAKLTIPSGAAMNVPSGYEALVIADTDVPNKKYVDDTVAAISWKEPVLVREDTGYASKGAAEVAMNTGTVDGVAVTTSDRLLYTNIAGNPVDIYTISGTVGAGALLNAVSPASPEGSTTYVRSGTHAGVAHALDENGTWTSIDREQPYDVAASVFGTISDATVFGVFVAVRGFTIQASGHDGYAITAPSGGAATITVTRNGGSIGTLVFNDGSNTLSSETISQTIVSAGERLVFTLTTGNSVEDFGVTLAGLEVK